MTRRATVWIVDLEGDQVDAIGHGFVELYVDERLDQSERLVFEIPVDHPKVDRIVPEVGLLFAGRRYFAVEVEQSREGSKTTVRVEAEAEWYRLGELVYPGSLLLEAVSPKVGAEQIVDGTGWAIESTGVDTGSFGMEGQDRTRLDLLRTWARITGKVLDFDTERRVVRFGDTRGSTLGLSFRYGRNVTGVRRRVRPPAVTRVYAYGADDLTVAGVNGGKEYVEDLSFYTAQGLTESEAAAFTKSIVWSDSSIVDETTLLSAANVKLGNEGVELVSYEIDVVDLSEQTEVPEVVRPGDSARSFDPDFGDVRLVVTRYEQHPLQPWRNKIELSSSPSLLGDGGSSARATSSSEWTQFVGPISATFKIRNDATWTVSRIPLRFREGGRANFHLDAAMTGVGTSGSVLVEVYDATVGATVRAWPILAYSAGATSRLVGTFAVENLVGTHDYRLRMTVATDGGASTSSGVDLVREDPETEPVSFYVLAQGAVKETPVESNSVTFEPSGVDQSFTVPDNVEEITIAASGAAGVDGGSGARVTVTVPVTPGEELVVISPDGTYPNGGGGGGPTFNQGRDGGGSAIVLRGPYTGTGTREATPGSLVDAPTSALLVVAPGGGGGPGGGIGGFFAGGDGGPEARDGKGGTLYSAGVKGTGTSSDGKDGGYLVGGHEPGGTSSGVGYGGGGGGGYFGGGKGGNQSVGSGGGGGGGSGFAPDSAVDLIAEDGAVPGNGLVVISWSLPDLGG